MEGAGQRGHGNQRPPPLLDTRPTLSGQAASSFLETGVQLGLFSRLGWGCLVENRTGPRRWDREPQPPLPSGPSHQPNAAWPLAALAGPTSSHSDWTLAVRSYPGMAQLHPAVCGRRAVSLAFAFIN